MLPDSSRRKESRERERAAAVEEIAVDDVVNAGDVRSADEKREGEILFCGQGTELSGREVFIEVDAGDLDVLPGKFGLSPPE